MHSATDRVFRHACAAFLVCAASTIGAPRPADAQEAPQPTELFPLSDTCMACHNGLVTPSGQDVSIGTDWRPSMMANSARDPYWQAAIRREVVDHGAAGAAIQDECATCHMPMARFAAHAMGQQGEIFSHLPIGGQSHGTKTASRLDQLAADGVSCGMCHQIRDDNFGEEASYTGGFVVDTKTQLGAREVFGPFEVQPGLRTIMDSATQFQPVESAHVKQSELCATCHTLYTHTLGPGGEVVGTLPEQVPYLEWRHSAYREVRSCQSCHMPALDEPAPLASVLAPMKEGFAQHVFRGGNFFVPRMMSRHQAELGVDALATELAASANRTIEHLQSETARLDAAGAVGADGRLRAEVRLSNLAGHKLPTAYPARRAWLHVQVWDDGRLVFESGRLREDGAIEGNDNDADPRRYEPHYDRIDAPDQVQIYEGILAEPDGTVTTGLLSAVRYVKDNRALPDGFDKETAVPDIAVQGRAAEDPDFTGGGDAVHYELDVGTSAGPFRVVAELWYQPISYRWAENHRGYSEAESQRFLRYWDGMKQASAVRITRAEAEFAPQVTAGGGSARPRAAPAGR